ncbi:hypothetical protein SRHO_G00217250 [Serrasalmus rhombeus]
MEEGDEMVSGESGFALGGGWYDKNISCFSYEVPFLRFSCNSNDMQDCRSSSEAPGRGHGTPHPETAQSSMCPTLGRRAFGKVL